MTVKLDTALPFHQVEWKTPFEVDVTAPRVGFEAPPEYSRDEILLLKGTTEKGCRVELGELAQPTDGQGRFALEVPLDAGENELVGQVLDPAGNATEFHFEVFGDRSPPTATVTPADGEVVKSVKPVIKVQTADDGAIARVAISVDGQALKAKTGADGLYKVQALGLAEGSRRLEIEVEDKAGRVSSRESWFVVDSSERFGDNRITIGAIGDDVKALQKRLLEQKMLAKDDITGKFDSTTEQAVRKVQEKLGQKVTGRVDDELMAALGPRIFVNQSRFSLVLDLPGKPLQRFAIATGSSTYPTPNGEFKVAEKVMYPTWLPPKSDWARDAKPIPPGPDNPLGTRWIGLDWGGVGIHGTNAPWSIGSASSHGCMRMEIPDVEALYTMVRVGTPVVIFGGWESDPRIKTYWP
ncbi:MAG: L,D-transpeptidase family protein [Vulcanimicrobiota bacterium]